MIRRLKVPINTIVDCNVESFLILWLCCLSWDIVIDVAKE